MCYCRHAIDTAILVPSPYDSVHRRCRWALQTSSASLPGGAVQPGVFVYIEPAPVETQGSALSTADIDAGETCYDTATLLPNVIPLLAAVPAAGCAQDIIVSPLSTLLAVGEPLGLTSGAVKAQSLHVVLRFCHLSSSAVQLICDRAALTQP